MTDQESAVLSPEDFDFLRYMIQRVDSRLVTRDEVVLLDLVSRLGKRVDLLERVAVAAEQHLSINRELPTQEFYDALAALKESKP